MYPRKIILLAILILIIAGWVSLFRNSKDTVPAELPDTDAEQGVVTLADGRQCYTYSHEATEAEPYTTTEFIDMTIAENTVTGTKQGTQSGPDMTNGYTGTIAGTLENNVITDVFSYTIEGSAQKEKEIFQASVTGIDKLRYQLKDEDGVLVPDLSTDFVLLHFARVGCTPSN